MHFNSTFVLICIILILTASYLQSTVSVSVVVDISVARAAEWTDQTIYGQVTVLPNTMADVLGVDTAAGFAIEDATGGIWVFISNDTFLSDTALFDSLDLGVWVTVFGYVDTTIGPTVLDDGGVIRISPYSTADITVGGNDTTAVEPTTIDIQDVDIYQGRLVKIENVEIVSKIFDNEWGKDYIVKHREDVSDSSYSNGTCSIWFYPSWSDADYVAVGVQYDYIIGFASVFSKTENETHVTENEWEIWPRSSDDWMETSTPTPPPSDIVEDAGFTNTVPWKTLVFVGTFLAFGFGHLH